MGEYEFRQYCKENILIGNVSPCEHSALTDNLLSNPGILGLRRIDYKYKEVALRRENGDEVTALDLIFFGKEVYICEVKVSDSRPRGKANGQLKRGALWIAERFKIYPTMISVQKFSNGQLNKRIIAPDPEAFLKIL